jgi:hypothetical protein
MSCPFSLFPPWPISHTHPRNMVLSSTISKTTQTVTMQSWQQLPSELLPTPTPTPHGSTSYPQTPPRLITQEIESGQGNVAQHTAPIPSGNRQDNRPLVAHPGSEGGESRGQRYQVCRGVRARIDGRRLACDNFRGLRSGWD